MKIEIPSQFKNIELSDREKIFAWTVVQISKKMNQVNWGDYTYVFHKRDINHILKRTEEHYLDNLRKVFNIGVLNHYTIAISWKNPTKQSSSGPGAKMPDLYETQLEDPHFFIMYSFLLGRMVGDSNIFNNDKKTLYEITDSSTANQAIHRLYKSYYKDELYGDE
jgi:hypothetical protein